MNCLKSEHIEMLHQINRASPGTPVSFQPTGKSLNQLDDFQNKVQVLLELKGAGYIDFAFTPHPESQTGRRLIDLVVVSGLTAKGQCNLRTDPQS